VTRSAYTARETAISFVINAVLSAAFCWLVFGGHAEVPSWSAGGLVVDYLPQGFMIGLMGALVPGLLARKARSAGRIDGVAPTPPPVGAVVRRALWTAVACALSATAIAALLLRVGAVEQMSFATAFVVKVASGIVLALVATPPAIRAALA
jgi:hypothetical protein